MRRFRVLLSLLLGLSLMTQGMTVAVAAVAASPAPAVMSAGMGMSADDHAMPCMDMEGMSDQAMPAQCPSKCCDGKVCLDMSSCAQAQPAISVHRMLAIFTSVAHNAPASRALITAERPPTSLLRPPITSHA